SIQAPTGRAPIMGVRGPTVDRELALLLGGSAPPEFSQSGSFVRAHTGRVRTAHQAPRSRVGCRSLRANDTQCDANRGRYRARVACRARPRCRGRVRPGGARRDGTAADGAGAWHATRARRELDPATVRPADA